MDNELKNELVNFVLKNITVRQFNLAIKNFNNQLLWRFCKNKLMEKFPQYKSHNGYYTKLNMAMTEALREYTCDEIECSNLRYKIDMLKRNISLYSKFHPARCAMIKEHNYFIGVYNKLLEPQNNLIKLFKKVHNEASK